MKKIAILLLLGILLSFGVACGGGSDTKTDAAETQDYRGGDDEIYQADDEKEEADLDAANEGDDQEEEK